MSKTLETNYALVAYQPVEGDHNSKIILHCCWYETKPTQEDVNVLIYELFTDKEFDMFGMRIDKDYFLVEVWDEESLISLKHFLTIPDILTSEDEYEYNVRFDK